MNLTMESSSAIRNEDVMRKKLDSYVQQTGIKDVAAARQLIAGHLLSNERRYPYTLFRSGTLYLFTVDGLSSAESLPSANGTDYLRFDGERITRLDPLYYLGPEGEQSSSAASENWEHYSNNNNNNNNNNNGNNGNNG